MVAEAEENNLGPKAFDERWRRWVKCSLCEQDYHGVVKCALGWACWKTYLGRPEADWAWRDAMTQLGNGLYEAGRHEDELSVREADLAMERRVGASEGSILIAQGNLATTYSALGRHREALLMQRDVYSGTLRLRGEEHGDTLREACNYADALLHAKRFEEARLLLRRQMPVARRVLEENDETTLRMKWYYARALYEDDSATLDDLHEAVNTLEDTEQTARRVLGGAHPTTGMIEASLRKARAALSAREGSSLSEAFAAMTPSPRV